MKISHKYLVLQLLMLIRLSVYGQDGTKEKILQVEKNLVGSIQLSGETPWTMQERMTHYKIRGLSIAVIQNYHIIWAKGYGWANDSLKIPVTTQTLFQAASISKSLNGVGLLKLVQEKKLDLYKDINTYLTSWQFPYDSLSKGEKISVANLLSHTGGLTVHGFRGYDQGVTLPTTIQILNGQKPANSAPVRSMYAPGKKSEYSGGGITISQLVLMDITHQPYADYMKKEVLRPLGMTASTYANPPVDVKPDLLATAYDGNGKSIPGKYHIYPEEAAAGLWTNPTDLANYIIETQLASEGKSAKVLDQSTTLLRLTPYLDKNAALGVFIENLDSTRYFGHGGANEGFRSQYYGSLQGGNGIVVMVNSDNGNIIPEVINSVAKVYGFKGLYRSTIKKTVSVPDSVLQTYVGQYALSPTFILTVTKEGKKLYTQATGQAKFEIISETQTKFFPIEFPADLEFIKDSTGVINAVVLYQNGYRNEAKKIK
ncbi:CubicO group peptidase, beta-lactamase class C family [Chitinophaga sp. CF118]|uniref:serine hydrolase n=1 Tax=Chitinophaga sp. CF118 TaxID=1884367 RepID=UPI0008DFAF4E|nr:serine hydrolase [Chitinophaga sp. CF118]SFD89319.1 CubicO group peptidase, beta-lactamase class C family [Chitinophaga sp. CF118]